MELPQELMTRPHLIRPSYLKVFNEYLEQLRRGCDGARVDYVLLDTGKLLSVTLSEYLARRPLVKV
jgi:hypothetical protein